MDINDLTSGRWDDSATVLMAVVTDVSRFYSAEVTILAIWSESPESVCVVYRRTQETAYVWGCRCQFPPHALNNDPSSTGAVFAEFLTEPVGSSFADARQDSSGVTWLIPPGSALPSHPGHWNDSSDSGAPS